MAIMDDTTPPQVRWFHLTPGRVVIALLAIEGLLWLSERFGCSPPGWPVLIAVAVVGLTVLLLLLWWAAALAFRWRFQYIRSLLLLMLVCAIPCSWLAVRTSAWTN